MGRKERRNMRERRALVQRLIKGVLQNPSLTLSVETLQAWLNVPVDAAERILATWCPRGSCAKLGVASGCLVRYQAHSPPLIDERVADMLAVIWLPRSGRCITADRTPRELRRVADSWWHQPLCLLAAPMPSLAMISSSGATFGWTRDHDSASDVPRAAADKGTVFGQ
jgi:hypothetical protein